MILFVGVDPGKGGAIAAVDRDAGNDLVAVHDMPVAGGVVTAPLLREVAMSLGWDTIAAVAVELVRSSPQQGVVSAFSFGRSYGMVLGFFGAHWAQVDVTPPTWKGHYRLNGKDKDQARAAAIKRWPHRAAWFARKKDLDRAEAALIALWLSETSQITAPQPSLFAVAP